MASEDIALMAHLMRRAGFGAGREELETRAAKGYEETVRELLNAEGESADRLEFLRYQPGHLRPITSPGTGGSPWLHTMVNTRRPLEEKMVLFWHQIFATGQSKVDHYHVLVDQVDMFREKALGNFRDLLGAVAKDPGMIYWLDNNDNHEYAVNENWAPGIAGTLQHGGWKLHRGRRTRMLQGIHRLDHCTCAASSHYRAVQLGVRIHRRRP